MHRIIETISKREKPVIIGISGFGGSGKSTLARKLALEINAPIIAVDSFYRSNDLVEYQLWDIFDFNRLEKEVIIPYSLGNSTLLYKKFDWEKGRGLLETTIVTDDYLIIEGVGLFRPQLSKYFSFSIWIDCPIDVAIERGKRRDREEYGLEQDEMWDGIWRKNDLQYFRRFKPKEIADLILHNGPHIRPGGKTN